MAANRVFMSSSGWSFLTSETTPRTFNIDEVTGAKPDRSSEKKEWYADGRAIVRKITTRKRKREITLMSGNLTQILAIPEGVLGTLTGTIMDPDTGTGTGSLLITLVNCQIVNSPIEAQDNEWAHGGVTFAAFSSDGTDPLTVTVNS